MQNLFFVAVVISIFSGATLSAKAQPSVNIERLNDNTPVKKSPKFIDGIAINTAAETALDSKIINKAAAPIIAKYENEASAIERCSALQFKYSILLDMDVEKVTNLVLLKEVENWLDTRYRYGGANEKGIDCSAYTGALLTDVYGLNPPRTSRAQFEESEKVEREDLVQGDLVFFNTRRRGRGVSHVGLYLGNGYFTHAGSSTGVTISNLDESYWSSKYIGGGRIIAPEPEQ